MKTKISNDPSREFSPTVDVNDLVVILEAADVFTDIM